MEQNLSSLNLNEIFGNVEILHSDKNSPKFLDDVLNTTCKVVVDLFKVDHCGLVIFDSEYKKGRVVAEFPNLGTVGVEVPITGVPGEEKLIASKKPLVANDVTKMNSLGSVRRILKRFGIQSILIIPIVIQDHVLGSFSLDAIDKTRKFTNEEIELCKIFASQVAEAVNNVKLLTEINLKAEQLERLSQTTLAMTSERNRDVLLELIVEQAVHLLRAKGGGIDRYHSDRGYLEIVADYGRVTSKKGMIIKSGEGMTGYLAVTNKPSIIIEDYRVWPHRLEEFALNRQFPSVMAVPMRWQSELIGVIYIDDELGRSFTQQDVSLLRLFADHAVIALINADLTHRETRKVNNLEKLSRAIGDIMYDLGTVPLNKRLKIIARYAAEILQSEGCGISLVKRPGYLAFEASFGYEPGVLNKGTEFVVQSAEGGGLSGYVASEGKIFNAYGEKLANHFAVKGDQRPPIASGNCYSILAIPLIGREGRLIGLLRVDNKKDENGNTHSSLYFDKEDEWILQLFANAAVIAIEGARLVEQLDQQQDQFKRLVANSPNGVIANDQDGKILVFNDKAVSILGYHRDEIVGKPVKTIYHSEEKASEIGLLVRERGEIINYETELISKENKRIPIRLTATQFSDTNGNLFGYVGYFEDMRIITEASKRVELLLKASNVLARADNLNDGLEKLAEMIVIYSGVSFCRFSLLDLKMEMLTTQAYYPLENKIGDGGWHTTIGQSTKVSEWPGLNDLLRLGDATILQNRGGKSRRLLRKWSQYLRTDRDIQSGLIVPLRTRDRVLGILSLGEIRPWDEAPISNEMKKLMISIAEQTAVLINLFYLYDVTKDAKDRLKASYEASNTLVLTQNPDKVWQEIVEQTRKVAGASGVRMFLIDIEMEQITDLVATGTDTLKVKGAVRQNGLSMKIMKTGEEQIVEDSRQDKRVNPTFFSRGIVAAAGLPVSVEGKRIGVIWVYYDKPRYFTTAEIESLQFYVNQAAIAYENARQIKELDHMHQAAKVLAEVAGLPKVLRRIVESACQVLEADSAVIWSFDNSNLKFNVDDSIAVGIPKKLWEQFQKKGPRSGGTADTVLSCGWIGVQDLNDLERYPFLGQSTQQLLTKVGVQSFQGIALIVNGEKMGVLYVDYKKPRHFSQREQETAHVFANYAAIALKNAHLLEKVRTAYRTAGIVADVTTLSNIEDTLSAIAKGIYEALRCDVITLYDYDAEKSKFVHSPKVIGARDPQLVQPQVKDEKGNLVYHVLSRRKNLIVNHTQTHPLFTKSRFTRDEDIASCTAAPLLIGNNIVGVVFINYRNPHRFTDDELLSIQLFANQAAIAIHNAQLYEREQRQTIALKALDQAAHSITSSLDLDQIFFTIAEQAVALTGADGTRARFSHIGLVERNELVFKATWPKEHLPDLIAEVGSIDLQSTSRIGVTGLAIAKKEAILVTDVHSIDYYIKYRPETRSEIAVPIKLNNEVIGVINVEHSQEDAFDKFDLNTLSTLAEYAAIAIKNADLYAKKQKHTAVLEALQEASLAVTKSLDLNKILNYIAEQACRIVRYQEQQISYTSIWLVKENSKLEPVAAYPPEDLKKTKAAVQKGIDMETGVQGRIGIIGRAIKKGDYVLVSDVTKDPDYLNSHDETLSELAVLMKLGNEIIGVINVEHSDYDAFSMEDVSALRSLAAQAAIAIRNAREYLEIKIIQEAAASLAGLNELMPVLNQVINSALKLTNATSGSILFWDDENKTFNPAFATEGPQNGLVSYQTTARPDGGSTTKIIQTKKSIIFPDTRLEPNINPMTIKKGRLSSVGVPIIRDDKVIAVLYTHSSIPQYFSDHQVTVLETLANQAAVAIDKAQQYEVLVKTKGRVGSRTALAWMGMLSNVWRHDIEGDAVAIRDAVALVMEDIKDLEVDSTFREKIDRKLEIIARRSRLILESPTTQPLSTEEGVDEVIINDLLRERLLQLWERDPYRQITGPNFHLEETVNIKIWASAQWLRVALDELVKNAVDSMKNSPIRRLDIYTFDKGSTIEVAFRDTGSGINMEVLDILYSGKSDLVKRDGHLGRGLLMVQAIIETYGGELLQPQRHTDGTTMLFSLPVRP